MPRAAIIVPSFQRPVQLRACLEAAIAQDHDDFEVVVVDDGSAIPLAEICAGFAPVVRCVRQANSGPAGARNRGAAETDAAFLAFTDDDCRPRPDWLSRLEAARGGAEARMIGGAVANGLPHDRYAAASQALCDFLYAHFDAEAGEMPFFTSNNIGCGRAWFTRLGGFDETFPLAAAEDRDFGLRWRDAGGELAYCAGAVVDHYHAMTLAKYWRQHRNYGVGARHLHRVLAARASDQPRREPASFYRDLVLWPMRSGGLRGVPTMPLMLLSQVAMVGGYSAALRRERRNGSPSRT